MISAPEMLQFLQHECDSLKRRLADKPIPKPMTESQAAELIAAVKHLSITFSCGCGSIVFILIFTYTFRK